MSNDDEEDDVVERIDVVSYCTVKGRAEME